jgi:cardiolipin synthase (CMP-forming)
VAQLGSAPDWGSGGRRFKSCRPDVNTGAGRAIHIPNGLSLLRLFGVPLFLWLILVPEADGWALVVLMVAGATDYFDGKIARRFHLESRLGELLDPAADRLYILAALIGLSAREIVPWWLAAIIIGRDLILAPTLPLLRLRGYGPLAVSFMGKAATFNLLYAFPLLLLGTGANWWNEVAHSVAWAFVIWGTVLYLVTGLIYLAQVRELTRR